MSGHSISRRRFLAASSRGAAATWLSALTSLGAPPQPPLAGAHLVRTLPLGDPLRLDNPPLNQLLGAGLDARLFLDLSVLSADRMITPNDRFFVRTECPPQADAIRSWTVALSGRVRRPQRIDTEALSRLAAPMGTHLLECAGNTNPNNFGLISAAQWDGVPLGALLARADPLAGHSYVRISGIDHDRAASRTSVPGASWIFARGDLERANAFLATHMNGAALPRDHGAPVRLVMPGWYGCTCIKWVNSIDVVPDGSPPTSQMVEFAARTHQPQEAALAQDFVPAVIDTAAMPIRVEQWNVQGRPRYRIVGIVWGGAAPVKRLLIRFRTGEAWSDVDDCPTPPTAATWSLWSHTWQPADAGRYHIVLRVKDPAVRTRRLDLFFYVRTVDITDV